jgi:phage terminase large subunit
MDNKIPYNAENLAYLVKRYRKDPHGFMKEVLLIPELDSWQVELLDLLKKGATRIAIASCNGSGKTWITSAIELWWLLCKPDATVSVCSATHSQLMDAHMRLVRHHISRSLVTDMYDTSNSSKIVLPNSGDAAYIAAVSNNKTRPEAIAGRHHGSLLTIFDEASGIHPEIFMAQEGNMTTVGATWIVIGNPISTGTAFHEIFLEKSNRWHTMHIDARDAKFTSKEWVEEMISTYGLEDDRVRARVLGQFPRGAINSVVGDGDFDGATTRYQQILNEEGKPEPKDPVVIGLDVATAKGRDSTVICARSGPLLVDIREIVHTDNYDLAEQSMAYMDKYDSKIIAIDYTGGYGAGPGDIIRRQRGDASVRDIQFAGKASDTTRWINKRAELWMKFGDWVKKAYIPNNHTLRKQSVGLEWWMTPNGRVQVESKDDFRKRTGNPSPDWADSVCCSLAVDPIAKTATNRKVNSAAAIIARMSARRPSGGLI